MRLIAAFVLVCVPLCRAAESAAARWEGAAQTPGLQVTLVIDLAQDTQGTWTGSAILPGFGVKGAPLADIVVQDSRVTFAIPSAIGGLKLDGHLAGNDSLAGDFELGGNKTAFILHKTGPPQVEPQRQSTAVRKELEGDWQGELAVPDGRKLRRHAHAYESTYGYSLGQIPDHR